MKQLLVSVIGLVIVLISAVLIGPFLIDWNSHQARLTAAVQEVVREATGGSVTIDGDVELALLPSPALSASSVSLRDSPGGSDLAIAELDELRLKVAFWPLFRGRVEVESMVFVRPSLRLEVLPDGTRNWDFALGTASAGPAGEAWLADRFRFGSYAVEDGTLIYRDAGAGTEERIEQIDAAVTADPVEGGFAIDGTAVVRGLAAEFEAILGRFDESGSAAVEATFGLPRAQATGVFDGTLTRQAGLFAAHGSLTGGGPSLAALIEAASAAGDFESGDFESLAALGNSFSIDAEVSADLERLALSGLELKLGETSLSGAVTARWGAPLRVEAGLAVAALDLDRLLAAAQAEPERSPARNGAALGFTLPGGIEADVDLRVDSLIYRGEAVRQLQVIGQLESGEATIHRASALLPGGTEISLSGSLSDSLPGPSFKGHLKSASDSLRAALEWIGVDVSEISAAHLAGVQLSAEIAATRNRLDLRDLDLNLDGSRAQGGIVVVLKERPALGVGLLIDRLDLGADPSGALWAQSRDLLRAFDANLDLRVGNLIHPDLTIEDVHLVGTLLGDVLTVVEASGRDLAGNFARYSGTVSGLGGDPVESQEEALAAVPVLDGTIELSIVAPARLAGLVDIAPDSLKAIGPFKLEGDLEADPSAVAFKARVAALGGRFDLDGSVRSLAAPMDFALSLDARHKDLAKLINRLANRRVLGPGLGGLAAKALVTGTSGKIEISKISGTLGPTRLEGDLTVDLSGARPVVRAIDLGVVAKRANLAHLLAALALPSPVGPAFGAVDIAGRISGAEDDLRLSGLTGRIGPIALSGELSARLTGSGATLTALDLGFELSHPSTAGLLAALSLETPVGPAFGAVDVSGRVSGKPMDLRFSDLSGRVGPVEMTGTIAADLAGPAPRVTDLALNLAIEHPSLAKLAAALGRPDRVSPSFGGIAVRGFLAGDLEQIEVRELQGTVGPGELRGSVAADLSGAKPKVSLDLTTGPLPIAVLLGSLGGEAPGTRWSSEPVDLSDLRQFDADLEVKSAAWLYDGYRLGDVALRATLRGGLFDLRQLTGTIYGGAIQLVGKVKAGKRLDAGLTVDAVDLEIAQLLRPHTDFDRVSGPVTLKASLISEGSSAAELVSGLNGRGTLTGSLTVEAEAQEAASATLLALLGGQQVAQGGSIDAGQTLLNAFAGEPAKLDGSFAVTRGVIRTDNARIDGRGAYARAQGRADLAAWRLDSRVDVYRLDNLEETYLTVDLAGPLDDPGSGFRSQRAEALLGSGHGSLIERVREFRGMLGEVVDFAPMARYVLGRHTETITPAQWSRFLQQYETLFLEGYEFSAGSSWTGEWNVQDIRPYGEDLLITVAFQDRSGGSSKVGFRVREKTNALFGFKIVDAISQGISLLVTQKSEFSSILKKQGVDGLTRVLEREFSETEPKADLPGVQDREALRIVPHPSNR